MRLDDIHIHDCVLRRVIECPGLSILAFEVDYPENWQANVFVPKTLVFRDPLGYTVEEGLFAGAPTLLGATVSSQDGRFTAVLDTNAGRRRLSYASVDLLDGHDAV